MTNNVIHPSFKHGANFKIGHFCVIEEDCAVGDDVNIQNYVLLKKGTRIGNKAYVDSYVRSSGDNYVGDNVTLRFGATVARKVWVGNGVFISPNVMTIYSKYTGEKSKGTLIDNGSFIGTAAVIGPNVRIGENVVIGSMAYVHKDCLEEGTYVGIPAKKI